MMDDENNNEFSTLNSQSIALRVQKKLASKMSNKSVAKIFIDDTTGRLLDNLNKLVKDYLNSKKQAELIFKDMIKIIVKIGILFKNNQLNEDELNQCASFRYNFHLFVKTALCFFEIDYSFDYQYLQSLLKTCQELIHSIVKNHLTDKSKNRVDNVFGFFSDRTFLEEIFKNEKYKTTMNVIVEDTRVLLDQGSI